MSALEEAAGPSDLVRVNAPRSFLTGFSASAREVWQFRELLVNLVRKELKVRYKDSVLGFLWSLARPLFLLAVYWLIFGKFLRVGIPNFAFYIFSGLVAWDLFGSTVSASTTSIVGNAGLIKKVYFPREILPLAAIGAGLVHFCLQIGVLVGVLVVFGYDFFGANLALFPLALVALVLLATAVGLFLSAANVYLRDTQHLLEVFLLFWFWLTPIVYPINTALDALGGSRLFGVELARLYLLNPMANVVLGFQRAFYKNVYVTDSAGNTFAALYEASLGAYFARLGAVIVFAAGLVWLAQRTFARVQGSFAQEL